MSKSTIYWINATVVVSIIASVIAFLVSVHERKDVQDPFRAHGSEYTYRLVFEGYAENLHQMAVMKEKCGHLCFPEQLVGCTNLPPYPPDTSNLDNLGTASNNLRAWLNTFSPEVDTECASYGPCRQWLEEKERKAREPPPNITFEEIGTLP